MIISRREELNGNALSVFDNDPFGGLMPQFEAPEIPDGTR
jgi:hypothetical protein